jgi:hypothetical protein
LYYRNPDYIIDVDRLTKAVRTMSEPKPVSLANRLILSVGLIVAPVITFFLILGVARLVAAF